MEKTFEGLKGFIVREQFINSSHKELAVYLRERAPETLEEREKIADHYLEAHKKNVFSPARNKLPTVRESSEMSGFCKQPGRLIVSRVEGKQSDVDSDVFVSHNKAKKVKKLKIVKLKGQNQTCSDVCHHQG